MTQENHDKKTRLRAGKKALPLVGCTSVILTTASILTLSVFLMGNVAAPQEAMAACTPHPSVPCYVLVKEPIKPDDGCPQCNEATIDSSQVVLPSDEQSATMEAAQTVGNPVEQVALNPQPLPP